MRIGRYLRRFWPWLPLTYCFLSSAFCRLVGSCRTIPTLECPQKVQTTHPHFQGFLVTRTPAKACGRVNARLLLDGRKNVAAGLCGVEGSYEAAYPSIQLGQQLHVLVVDSTKRRLGIVVDQPTRRSCRATPPRRKKGRIEVETPTERSRANCAREPDHETDPGVCRHHPLVRWPEEASLLTGST